MSQLAQECNIYLLHLCIKLFAKKFIAPFFLDVPTKKVRKINNSQVTKAHDYLNNNHISNNINSHLSQYFYILNYMILILEQRNFITIRRWVKYSALPLAFTKILAFTREGAGLKENKLNYYYIFFSSVRWLLILVILLNLIVNYEGVVQPQEFFNFYLLNPYLIKAYIAKSRPSLLNKFSARSADLNSLLYKNLAAIPGPPAGMGPNKLNAYYVTGFTDGDGAFLINIRPKIKHKIKYSVELVFKITLHSKDKTLLENIRNYFGVGTITYRTDGYIQYWVGSIKDLEIIVQHFDSYTLITKKWEDYQLFKQVFELIKCKEHLTHKGLKKIVSIKAVFNKGLSDHLKMVFPPEDNIPAIRPQIINQVILDPHWMSGFVDAEGCFLIAITPTKNKVGGIVKLKFSIAQHSRDECLLKSFVNYFGFGNYYNRSGGAAAGDFMVSKFADIYDNIIPFFEKYPLQGEKSKDFADFKKAAQLIKSKAHLELEGFEKVKQIKSRMNKKRENLKITSLCTTNTMSKLNRRSYSTVCNLNSHQGGSFPCSNDKIKFKEWLGGIIDGNGQFNLTKKGYARFILVFSIEDKAALYEIKHKYGGSIKHISGGKSLKYKLFHKKGLLNLINDINGLIRNPARMLQLNKLCVKYNIELKEPLALTYNNGWFSGLLDSDGSINIDEKSGQLSISIIKKNKYLLEPLQILYAGRIKILRSKEAFIYSIFRKKEIQKLVDGYFKNYPLKFSSKLRRFNLIKNFYELKDHCHLNIDKFNQWIIFKNKWEKYKN